MHIPEGSASDCWMRAYSKVVYFNNAEIYLNPFDNTSSDPLEIPGIEFSYEQAFLMSINGSDIFGCKDHQFTIFIVYEDRILTLDHSVNICITYKCSIESFTP